MTVAATAAKAGPYTGNDSASTFAFAFKVFADTDIRVVETLISTEVETDLVLNTNYTVTRNVDQDADPGGEITYKVGGVTTALPSTKKLTIVGDFDFSQPTDIPNGGAFFASTIETALDRQTMLVKQIKERVDRAVAVDVSSTTNPDDLLDELQTDVLAAAASAAAAAASESAAASSAADAAADAAAIIRVSTYGNDLAAAVAAIGAAKTTLVIDTEIDVAGVPVTQPSTMEFSFTRAGIINDSVGGGTLTINGQIQAGDWQIFGDNLTIDYNGSGKFNAAWKGFLPTNTAAGNVTAFSSVMAAVDVDQVITALSGDYPWNSLEIAKGVTIEGTGVHLRDTTPGALVRFLCADPANPAFTFRAGTTYCT